MYINSYMTKKYISWMHLQKFQESEVYFDFHLADSDFHVFLLKYHKF